MTEKLDEALACAPPRAPRKPKTQTKPPQHKNSKTEPNALPLNEAPTQHPRPNTQQLTSPKAFDNDQAQSVTEPGTLCAEEDKNLEPKERRRRYIEKLAPKTREALIRLRKYQQRFHVVRTTMAI